MDKTDAQMVPAPLGPVERGVGRPVPERADAGGRTPAEREYLRTLSELVVVVPAGGGYLSKRAWDALEMARHVLGREELSASEAEA